MKDLTSHSVAIIGAGMAGIAAASQLQQRGAHVEIFEKSRGLGGRCATKRWQEQTMDHGAQDFTQRDPRFIGALAQACGDRLLPITMPLRDAHGNALQGRQRWFHREGMSRLARDLAAGVQVHTAQELSSALPLLERFDAVLSTAPWPQTQRLFGLQAGAAAATYLPCLAALFLYRGLALGRSADTHGFHQPGMDLAWSACENHKPGRIQGEFTAIVAHAGTSLSQRHLELGPEAIADLLRPLVEQRWQLPPEALAHSLGHRWRLARVGQSMSDAPALPAGLHFAGDALRQSRVEDAWLAGHQWACQYQP